MKVVRLLTEGYKDEISIIELLKGAGMEEYVELRSIGKKSKLIKELPTYCERFYTANPDKHLFVLCDLFPLNKPEEMPHSNEGELRQILVTQVNPQYNQYFHPHVAKWELEAWMFADVNTIEEKLKIDLGDYHSYNPEKIDDRTPPSRVLEIACSQKRKHYSKIENNPSIFRKLSIDKVRLECQFFRIFWDDLLETINDC